MLKNRKDAGQQLAGLLQKYGGRDDVIVLGLPRGGVPVAYEVAEALRAPLDIFAVRKLGLPSWPELAMGAIASGGAVYLNDAVIQSYGISASQIERVRQEEEQELWRREQLYRQGLPPLDVKDRIVILVDDGMATGATAHAAVLALRMLAPKKIVVAMPVAPAGADKKITGLADEFFCVEMPCLFDAVGSFYQHFNQTSDEEVRALLRRQPLDEEQSKRPDNG